MTNDTVSFDTEKKKRILKPQLKSDITTSPFSAPTGPIPHHKTTILLR